MKLDKKIILIFFTGFFFGLAIVFFGEKLLEPFIDTKSSADFAA